MRKSTERPEDVHRDTGSRDEKSDPTSLFIGHPWTFLCLHLSPASFSNRTLNANLQQITLINSLLPHHFHSMKFLFKIAPVAFLSLLATAFGVNAATIKRADVCNGHAEVSPQILPISCGTPLEVATCRSTLAYSRIPIVMHQDVRSSNLRWSSQLVRSRRHLMYVPSLRQSVTRGLTMPAQYRRTRNMTASVP